MCDQRAPEPVTLNIQNFPKRDLAWAYEEARQFVRRFDKDRYSACLFALPERRKHLFALYAFAAEIARVREIVSDPLPVKSAINGGAICSTARRMEMRKPTRLQQRCCGQSRNANCPGSRCSI